MLKIKMIDNKKLIIDYIIMLFKYNQFNFKYTLFLSQFFLSLI